MNDESKTSRPPANSHTTERDAVQKSAAIYDRIVAERDAARAAAEKWEAIAIKAQASLEAAERRIASQDRELRKLIDVTAEMRTQIKNIATISDAALTAVNREVLVHHPPGRERAAVDMAAINGRMNALANEEAPHAAQGDPPKFLLKGPATSERLARLHDELSD